MHVKYCMREPFERIPDGFALQLYVAVQIV